MERQQSEKKWETGRENRKENTEEGTKKTLEKVSGADLKGKKVLLEDYLTQIRPADPEAMAQAKRRFDSIAKPIGSLGVLERDLIRMRGIRGMEEKNLPGKAALAIMCADHGVVAEGVTQTGQEVTRIVAENFASGQACASIMCREAGIDVFPVDIGMNCGRIGNPEPRSFSLLDRKVASGSKNLFREPAMTMEECKEAVLCGLRLAGELKEMGYGILLAGEMGIGNTTPTSAMIHVLTGLSITSCVGRGAGLSDEGLERKRKVVSGAAERFFLAHPSLTPDFWKRLSESETGPEPEAVLTLLSELGGFDLAGMAGLFLGGAVYRLPVVIDGCISAAAALLAVRMAPAAKQVLFASHVSAEPAGQAALSALGLSAPLDLQMHLGEGTGAALFIPLLRMGAAVYDQMETFEEIQVTPYVDYEADKENRS